MLNRCQVLVWRGAFAGACSGNPFGVHFHSLTGVCPLCSHALQGNLLCLINAAHVLTHMLHWRAGVLTKLDIMDPGTNARDVLDGQSVRLKHGWIGIVNRGQADIMSKVSAEQASALA